MRYVVRPWRLQHKSSDSVGMPECVIGCNETSHGKSVENKGLPNLQRIQQLCQLPYDVIGIPHVSIN